MAKSKYVDPRQVKAELDKQRADYNGGTSSTKGGVVYSQSSVTGKKFVQDYVPRVSDGKGGYTRDTSGLKRSLTERFGPEVANPQPFIYVGSDGKPRKCGSIRHFEGGDYYNYNAVGLVNKAYLENTSGVYYKPDFSEPDRYSNGNLKPISRSHRNVNNGIIKHDKASRFAYNAKKNNPNFRYGKLPNYNDEPYMPNGYIPENAYTSEYDDFDDFRF